MHVIKKRYGVSPSCYDKKAEDGGGFKVSATMFGRQFKAKAETAAELKLNV